MNPIQHTYSPVDGALYVARPLASASDIDTAVARAEAAQRDWRQQPLAERQALCERAVEAFVARKAQLAEELCWQMGRPIRFAGGEVDGFAERARYMIGIAEAALASLTPDPKPGFRCTIRREPLGLVLVIAPWNYPYLTAVNAIVPALLAGNAVLLKHSAQTPLCAERIAEAFAAAGLPDGVLQYLHLSHESVTRLVADPAIGHVAFTGSVAGGEAIERAAAGRFIGVNLELGGKDAAYIRADADLDRAVASVIDGAFFNSGQSCCAIERIYVHQDCYPVFMKRAVELISQYRLGRPDDPTTTLGPLVRPAAADFVRDQIREAVAQGARPHIDPAAFPADAPGTPYLAPQLLTNVDHRMRVMTEESFGPVVGVMPVADDETALRLINDSPYGLSAAIYSRDTEAAAALGERAAVGTLFVNRCDYLDPALAWTGIKQSGRGCSLSALGFQALTRPKSFHIKNEL